VAGVFAGDLVGFLRDAEGAESNVLQMSDGRADKIEAASDVLGIGLACQCGLARRARAGMRLAD